MKKSKNNLLLAFISICIIFIFLFISACSRGITGNLKNQETASVNALESQTRQDNEEDITESITEYETQKGLTGAEDSQTSKEILNENDKNNTKEEDMAKLTIESPSFGNNEMIPSKYTCDGQNINPPLKISGVSNTAKSLVLIMDDPDAPMGTWVHWTIWNINPKITEILENNVPENAVEGITSFKKPGYGGPCPPSGTHRYFFKLYALDTMLELNSKASASDIEKAMEGHILDSAELIGLYKRN